MDGIELSGENQGPAKMSAVQIVEYARKPDAIASLTPDVAIRLTGAHNATLLTAWVKFILPFNDCTADEQKNILLESNSILIAHFAIDKSRGISELVKHLTVGTEPGNKDTQILLFGKKRIS